MGHNAEEHAPDVARPSPRRDISRVLVSGLAYFLAHRIAFLYPDAQQITMLIWPAAGIALAAFLLSPGRLWPALTLIFALSGIISDVPLGGRSLTAGVGFMAGDMVESIGCALFILRWSRDFHNFDRVKEVLALIAGAVFISALSSCIGAGTSMVTSGTSFARVWQSWYVADCLGILLVGPFIVVWIAEFRNSFEDVKLKDVVEFVACMVVVTALALAVFNPVYITSLITVHPYVLVAALIWPALRLGLRGVTLALVLLFVAAIVSPAIANGPSPWGGTVGEISTRLADLQLFVGCFAIVGYMMAASFTTLVRAEKELRISQAFLNNIIDCSPNSLWIADERGFVIRTNQALRDTFHARDENVVGKYSILNDNVVEKHGFMPLVRDVFEKGIAAHFVIQYDTAEVNGISFDRPASMYLDVKISPVLDQRGKVTNAIIQHTDMTERRRAEEELRRSEDRFRQLAENFPETIFEADLTGKVMYANRHGMEWFGLCNADIDRGVNILEFVAPRDRGKVQERIQQRVLGRAGGSMEYTALRKDGQSFDALVYSALMYNSGGIAGISGFIVDVSERKRAERSLRESEERYRQLIETMTDGVYRSSHEGKFLEVNPALVKILGYKDREELLGIDIKSDLYFAPGDRESAALEEKLEEMAVFRLKKKDGSEVWVEDHGRHVIGENGNVLYHEGVLRDVTERMRAEEALRQAQKLNSIGTLAGGIAHDFNNVLGGIIGYADMSLRYAEKGSVLERNLLKILKVSDRAKQLIQQILTFSRKGSTHRSVISLRPVIEEVLELLKASIPSSVMIRSDVSRQTNPVLADPTKIHEAVLNLATNAVHAMNRKGTLTIRLYEENLDRKVYGQSGEIAPGEYTVVEVADTGCGMDAATLSKAFEPFFTTKGVGEGTGMGLSVVLGVVQSAGGDVLVETGPGTGTTFRLYLPVSKEPAITAAHDNDMIPFFGTEQILFVDDERMLVETARDLLAQLGYRVTGTSSSLEALKLLRDGGNEFDILITDQTMPGMTGIELVREVRAVREHLPVILCTGFSDDLTPETAASLGINRIIMKPYRYNDVAKAIRDIIDG